MSVLSVSASVTTELGGWWWCTFHLIFHSQRMSSNNTHCFCGEKRGGLACLAVIEMFMFMFIILYNCVSFVFYCNWHMLHTHRCLSIYSYYLCNDSDVYLAGLPNKRFNWLAYSNTELSTQTHLHTYLHYYILMLMFC